MPSRDSGDHRRRFETPPTKSGEEVKGKGKGARRALGGGGQDSPFDDAMRSLRKLGAFVKVQDVRDVPSSHVNKEAEVAATTSLDGDGDDEGLVDEEASLLHALGLYLSREAKRGSMMNKMSVELLGEGIKILEGILFLS